MNILYTTDSKFLPQVAASMCSIMENNRHEPDLHFYILGLQISDDALAPLIQFTAAYHRTFTHIPLNNIQSYYPFVIDTSGWHPIVLARLIIDKLLPKEVTRVIYLDGDTIVRGSLSALYNTDMHGAPIGGCQEATYSKSNLEALQLSGTPYINAGVLLIDLEVWRKEKTGDAIIAYYAAHSGRLFANDQDAINGALNSRLYLLPLSYNYCNSYDYYTYAALKKMAAPAPFVNESDYRSYVQNPIIIHYLGEERPWRAGNRHRYGADYLHYLSLTPYKDTPMETGWETYFKVFSVFNALTKPFPLLRHRLITGLIPLFMQFRRRMMAAKKN